MPTNRWLKEQVSRRLPRVLSILWAAWAAATAAAYADGTPPQLLPVDSVTPIPLSALWSIASGLLLAGVLVRTDAPPCAQNVARWLRLAGIALIVGLLIVWSFAFFFEAPRGWVSGKNYLLAAALGTINSWTIARNQSGWKARADV